MSMTNQQLFNKVYTHLLTQGKPARTGIGCVYRGDNGLKCAVGCLIPDYKYDQSMEQQTVDSSRQVRLAAGISKAQVGLAQELQNCHDSWDVDKWPKQLGYIATKHQLTIPGQVQVLQRTRQKRILSLTSQGGTSISTVARILDCPEASIRRDLFHLRQAGYYITLQRGRISNYGKRSEVARG